MPLADPTDDAAVERLLRVQLIALTESAADPRIRLAAAEDLAALIGRPLGRTPTAAATPLGTEPPRVGRPTKIEDLRRKYGVGGREAPIATPPEVVLATFGPDALEDPRD